MKHGGDNNMSKYLEFKQIPFKGKTKRFEIVSKISFEDCQTCLHRRIEDINIEVFNQAYKECKTCDGTGIFKDNHYILIANGMAFSMDTIK